MSRARPTHLAALAAVVATLFSAMPSVAAAQDQVLLGSRPQSTGAFGGPIIRVTQVAGETIGIFGGGGSVLFNRRFAIGGEGFGGTTSADVIIGGTPQRGEMDFAYGGLTLDVITRPSKLVHVTYGVLIGGGAVSVWPDNLRPRHPTSSGDPFGAIEPRLGIELNLTRSARVGLSGGYRFTYGSEIDGLVNNDLNGSSGSIVFRFGRF